MNDLKQLSHNELSQYLKKLTVEVQDQLDIAVGRILPANIISLEERGREFGYSRVNKSRELPQLIMLIARALDVASLDSYGCDAYLKNQDIPQAVGDLRVKCGFVHPIFDKKLSALLEGILPGGVYDEAVINAGVERLRRPSKWRVSPGAIDPQAIKGQHETPDRAIG